MEDKDFKRKKRLAKHKALSKRLQNYCIGAISCCTLERSLTEGDQFLKLNK
jgi:hypothetical protein